MKGLKESVNQHWHFQRDGGGGVETKKKNSSVGGVGIFSGTTHCHVCCQVNCHPDLGMRITGHPAITEEQENLTL